MRKIVLLFAFALGVTAMSYGQFALGIKLGYNGSSLTTNMDSIKNQFNNGFHAGVYAHFGKRLYIAPELLYSMSGGVFTHEKITSPNYFSQKIKIGSFDIPVLVGFKIIHSDVITWRIELGPEASFAMSKKLTDPINPKITADDINTANWYVLGGTGIDFLMFNFDVRYKYGLSNLVSDASNLTFDAKNRVLLISVGWKIFGKK
jgi:hypothetical protein